MVHDRESVYLFGERLLDCFAGDLFLRLIYESQNDVSVLPIPATRV